MIRYKHSQFGWVIVSVLLLVAAIVFVAANFNIDQAHLTGVLVPEAVILLVVLVLFYNLTTTVTDENLLISFGIGLVRRVIPLERLQSVSTINNSFVLGWGIRIGAGFTLWNVSGFKSVELTFNDKKWKFRIGTDQPEELCKAINEAIKERGPSGKAG